jgi:hypothetical protein
MVVETHVDRARDRVAAELSAARNRRNAYRRFVDRVADVRIERPATSAGATTVTTAGPRTQGSGAEEGARAVRTAFAETVYATDGGERTVQAAFREAFSPAVAAALSPTSGASPTPAVRRAVLERARSRVTETRVLERALEREAEALEPVATTVSDVTDWLVAENPTPLSDLEFHDLRERHERLEGFRDRCRTHLHERQALLRETTSLDGAAGLRHRSLVASCYDDFPVDYPVLSTLVALEDTCASAQRSLRSHLVTRV